MCVKGIFEPSPAPDHYLVKYQAHYGFLSFIILHQTLAVDHDIMY